MSLFIQSKKKGITTDEQGCFHLKLNGKFKQDTITILLVGYKPLMIPVYDLIWNTKDNKVTLLEEVIIFSSKKQRTKRFGRKGKSGLMNFDLYATEQNSDGFMNYYKLKNKKYIVDKISFSLKRIYTKTDSILLRVSFNKVDNQQLSTSLLKEDIILRVPVNKGWLTPDLKKYNIILNDNFFCGLEVLPQKDLEVPISLSGKFGGKTLFTRNGLEYYRMGIGSISLYVDAFEVE